GALAEHLRGREHEHDERDADRGRDRGDLADQEAAHVVAKGHHQSILLSASVTLRRDAPIAGTSPEITPTSTAPASAIPRTAVGVRKYGKNAPMFDSSAGPSAPLIRSIVSSTPRTPPSSAISTASPRTK